MNSPPPAAQPEFRHEGLTGRTINHIHQHDDMLFATSDAGLFGKPLDQDNWWSLGLDDYKVQDVVFVDDQHWLAAVFAAGPNPFLEPRLLETLNGGANWLNVETDFGGDNREGIFALHFDAERERLYATGISALAVSEDLGRSWELLDGDWGAFSQPMQALNLNPATNQMWFGGQNAIEEMVLRRHNLETAETLVFPQLLPSPSVVMGITFDPGNADRVLVSGEGGVLQSLDNGETWTALLGDVDFRFYFQTALDPEDSQTIYTAGWTKMFDEPQPLILEISTDGGDNWVSLELDDPELFGGAWSISAVTENDGTVLYIGLYRGGIMKVLLSPAA